MTLIEKLRSQIGDDVQHVFDHQALFRLAADRIEELEAENFALAAQQCLFSDGSGLCGDEWGHQYCAMKRRAEAAEAKLAQAVAGERERCARVADAQEGLATRREAAADDDESDWDGGVVFGTKIGARMIAAAIREGRDGQ